MKKLGFIFGTRPEAIKMAPVILEAQQLGLETFVITTGQHRDLLPQALDDFGIQVDQSFDLMVDNQNASAFLERCENALSNFVNSKDFSYIFVQGDTASTLAAARAARRHEIPIGHIEAGIRSHNLKEPWPEESYRIEISKLATHHFAPTRVSFDNLIEENIPAGRIYITGNTVVDALQLLGMEKYRGREKKDMILLSVHRRENTSRYASEMVELLRDVFDSFSDFVFAVVQHPNPDSEALLRKATKGKANVKMYPPLPYSEMIQLMSESNLIVTDSGGLQEEASELQIPIVVLRGFADRPESLGRGAYLVGRDTDLCLQAIYEGLRKNVQPCNPFGQVGASKRVALLVKRILEEID